MDQMNISAPTPSTPTPEGTSTLKGGPTLSAQNTTDKGDPTHTRSNLAKEAPKTSSADSEIYEVKVNGKVVKMTKQEVLDHASMAHAANDKFNQASTKEKQIQKIISRAKSNPIEALMDPELGLSKDQIREAFESWYAKEYIEPESLSEEGKKLRETERRLKDYEDREAEKKKLEEQDNEQKLTAKEREYLQTQIIEGLEASGLPKTPFFAKRMAFYMQQNLKNGWEAPLPMIVSQVKKEFQSMTSHLGENSTVEQLISLFGEGLIQKIRVHDLKNLRESKQAKNSAFGGDQAPELNSNSGEKVSYRDVTKRLREMREKGNY